MYKLFANKNRDGLTGEANNILRTTDNVIIPKDPANTDYQEYLAWVAEGNTPEEAE
jgi:hypothetical protein